MDKINQSGYWNSQNAWNIYIYLLKIFMIHIQVRGPSRHVGHREVSSSVIGHTQPNIRMLLVIGTHVSCATLTDRKFLFWSKAAQKWGKLNGR